VQIALTDDGGGHVLVEVDQEELMWPKIAIVVDGPDGQKYTLLYNQIAREVVPGAMTYYLVDAEAGDGMGE
jgi:hypothetical protein